MKRNKKNTKKHNFFCKFERFMYKSCIVIILALVVGIICSETNLAKVNLEVQRKEKEVDNQTKKIESLKMKIDEMTSFERIKELSLEYGLDYHSENIKTIDK